MFDDELMFELYWDELQELARKHRVRIYDRDAWKEPFDQGQSAAEAFFDEYPEYVGDN